MFSNFVPRLKRKVCSGAVVASTVLAPMAAYADDVAMMPQAHGNILWTLIAAILVMLMQAGFSMVEIGFTRAKNAGNILMKNFLDFAAGSVMFFLFGFAIMFGMDSGGLFGTSGFALSGVPHWCRRPVDMDILVLPECVCCYSSNYRFRWCS